MAILFGGIFGLVGHAMKNEGNAVNAEWEEFKEDACVTIGEIVESGDGTTVVEYYVEDEDEYYTVTYNMSSSSYSEGTPVDVYYDEDYPDECMVPEIQEGTFGLMNNIFSGLGLGLGIFFAIFGLPFVIGGIVLIKKAKATYDNGVSQEI